MYFLVALGMSIISLCLFLFVKTKRNLHFEFLVFTFGAATLMWLIDCIAGAIEEGQFLSFELPLDIWISVWTVVGGIAFYLLLLLIFTIKDKKQKVVTE
ncbi:MAG: hypothetical protein IJR08_02855 [Bacilli bacterium]|nr:hypothetical protein [Bacilli bacterium]